MAYEDYCVTATAAPNDEGEPQVRAFAATTKDLVDEARRIHGQGPTVTAALGRLLTAGVMMGDMLKNDTDLLTMQIRGTGPAKSLVVTADNAGNVKGYAGVPTAEAPVINPGHFNVAGCIGQGTLTVIKAAHGRDCRGPGMVLCIERAGSLCGESWCSHRQGLYGAQCGRIHYSDDALCGEGNH